MGNISRWIRLFVCVAPRLDESICLCENTPPPSLSPDGFHAHSAHTNAQQTGAREVLLAFPSALSQSLRHCEGAAPVTPAAADGATCARRPTTAPAKALVVLWYSVRVDFALWPAEGATLFRARDGGGAALQPTNGLRRVSRTARPTELLASPPSPSAFECAKGKSHWRRRAAADDAFWICVLSRRVLRLRRACMLCITSRCSQASS
jgi:hypothetical protein